MNQIQNLELKLEVLHLLLLQEGVELVLESKDPAVIKLLEEEFENKSLRANIEELGNITDGQDFYPFLSKIRDFLLEQQSE